MRPIRIMLDIETHGTRPDSKIIALGAMIFDGPAELPMLAGPGSSFECGVTDCGGTEDSVTLAWWASPDRAEARAYLDTLPVLPPAVALSAVKVFALAATDHSPGHPVEWWAKSPSFDMVMVEEMLARNDLGPPPWHFRETRDVRTILSLAAELGLSPARYPTEAPAHSPLADCDTQASDVMQCLRFLSARGGAASGVGGQ